DNDVATNNAYAATVSFDLDMIGALVRRPGQVDVGGHGICIENRGGRIFDRPITKATLFQQRADAAGDARPPDDAIERMPTMVEQYSAAGHSRIGAPVAAVRCNCDCRLRAQSLPADVSYSADRTLIYERRYLVADWCLQPVVHRVDGAAAFASSRGDGLRIFNPRDQRLFAKNMMISIQGAFDERCVPAWRGADVDEIKCFVRQQIVHALVPSTAGTSLHKGPALRRDDIGRGDDLNVLDGLPARQMPFRRDVSKSYKSATQHAPQPQSSLNCRAMAPKDWSRMSMPRNASSWVITSGGLMRMTCEYDIVTRPRRNASWKSASVMALSNGSLVLRSATSSTPIIRPRPRTSPMKRYLSCSFFSASSISAPTRAEFSTSPSLMMASTAPRPAAAASGFPP